MASTGFRLSCGFLTHDGNLAGFFAANMVGFVIVTTPSDPLPADLAAAHAMILAQRELLTLAKSEVTVGRLEIERLKLMLAKARREQFGQSSERGKLLVEQLELAIEDLEETQAEQEAKAEIAAPEAAKQKRRAKPAAASTSPAGQSAGRTHRRTRALRVWQVRQRAAAQARRGSVENPGMRAAALEDYRARPREVLLPGLRGDHRGAGALPSDPARLCRTEPAGDGAVRQVPAASAVEPSEQDLRPRRDRDRCLDAGRSGRRLRGGARPDYSGDPDRMS